MDAVTFFKLIREKMKLVEIDESLLSRSLNDGFSGGEKKRNEIFQMAVLEPDLLFWTKLIQDWILTP